MSIAVADSERWYTGGQQLHAGDLVHEANMLRLATLARSERAKRWIRSTQIISRLEDTFELDVAVQRENVWVLRMLSHLGRVGFAQMFQE